MNNSFQNSPLISNEYSYFPQYKKSQDFPFADDESTIENSDLVRNEVIQQQNTIQLQSYEKSQILQCYKCLKSYSDSFDLQIHLRSVHNLNITNKGEIIIPLSHVCQIQYQNNQANQSQHKNKNDFLKKSAKSLYNKENPCPTQKLLEDSTLFLKDGKLEKTHHHLKTNNGMDKKLRQNNNLLNQIWFDQSVENQDQDQLQGFLMHQQPNNILQKQYQKERNNKYVCDKQLKSNDQLTNDLKYNKEQDQQLNYNLNIDQQRSKIEIISQSINMSLKTRCRQSKPQGLEQSNLNFSQIKEKLDSFLQFQRCEKKIKICGYDHISQQENNFQDTNKNNEYILFQQNNDNLNKIEDDSIKNTSNLKTIKLFLENQQKIIQQTKNKQTKDYSHYQKYIQTQLKL